MPNKKIKITLISSNLSLPSKTIDSISSIVNSSIKFAENHRSCMLNLFLILNQVKTFYLNYIICEGENDDSCKHENCLLSDSIFKYNRFVVFTVVFK